MVRFLLPSALWDGGGELPLTAALGLASYLPPPVALLPYRFAVRELPLTKHMHNYPRLCCKEPDSRQSQEWGEGDVLIKKKGRTLQDKGMSPTKNHEVPTLC